MAAVGVVFSFMSNAVILWLYDAVPMAGEVIGGAVYALQQILFVGGIFMAIGSIVVRHFEVLRDEMQRVAGGGLAGPGQKQG
ncbi:hypothetical protein ACFY5D_18010 [Paeniglutamicibacter sp. NPDC012692]|uniref:hypothetical protein n=1 Tax=Paeniglutamicibacter sp. NPDC012692 TaxID=3364388 RepID=UPI0036C4EFCC